MPRQTKKRSRTRRATLCCILAMAVTKIGWKGLKTLSIADVVVVDGDFRHKGFEIPKATVLAYKGTMKGARFNGISVY